ncbi:MAG: isoleucine--tRNA ligase [Patescibacteria group bacterium]|jgi:isoleucyl-tRNA synthetase|nr:isoleucine--tRNA ligase [Patescibacteria group bacterium]
MNNNNNNLSIPEIEKKVQDFWSEANIFNKSVEKDAPKGPYVFFDGPPFATGTPHYGHLIGNVMKDVIPRFQTMRGHRVERKWGWDCHGLPIENIVEKELGIKSKKEIEDIGVDKFNQLCRKRVSTYIDDWKKTINNLGRFVDMDNSYRTMDLDFMESVWWVFKKLWDNDLIYKDYRSMHVCPRCETTLSQSEVTEGYKNVKDISAISKFKLKSGQKINDIELGNNVYILAWTTTPWTLIGNVALAVSGDIDYVLIESEGIQYILAEKLLESVLKDKEYEIIEKFDGFYLLNLEYIPPFNYYLNDTSLKNYENGWKIYEGNFVTTEEGTGIVHIAPAFGEDDMELGKEKSLPFIQHVKLNGEFSDEVLDFKGLNVKPIDNNMSTDIEIIKYLAHNDKLFHKEKYEHSYPHCWRCDTPLINYATSSWFVGVNKIKDELLESAKEINWSPNYLKNGRFGNWLEGARDWSISRQRFWASCIPIWECECSHRHVVSSVKELEELTGEKVTDIHKDKIDHLTFECPKCGKQMKRIPDVLDCWFESGSMPYAQMHYPFENKQKLEENFPADFVAEGVDQTRTWFYYLHVISGGVNKGKEVRQAYNNVIANGIVLAEDGKKMAKKLQNYPDPNKVMEKYGADALRSYLMASPVIMAENLNFSEKGVAEAMRKNVMLLLNIYKFYQMFLEDGNDIDISNTSRIESDNVLDVWLMEKLAILNLEIESSLDPEKNSGKEINLARAMRKITIFIDEFSTWYIRRSRDRFKSDNLKDKEFALKTTSFTLLNLSKIIAPFTPFVAEHIWQKLTNKNFMNNNESVHLEDWPNLGNSSENKVVLDKMELVRDIVSVGLARRDEKGIKIRQMLNTANVIIKIEKKVDNDLDENYLSLVTDELNLRSVDIKFVLNNKVSDLEGERIQVELDTNITEDLKQEGIKRELIRFINMIRKNQGLKRGDLAKVLIETSSEDISKTLEKMGEEISKETLSESIKIEESIETENKAVKINGEKVRIEIIK